MLDPKKLAIVIPLFNDAERIERAIRSAHACDMPPGFTRDVLVVDDGSVDDSYRLAQRVASELDHVQVLQAPQNGGPSRARNLALERSNAAWFTPLDSDDIMAPGRLVALIRVAEETGAVLVADNLMLSDEARPETCERLLWPGKTPGRLRLTPEMFIRRCYQVDQARSELGYLKPLIDRRVLAEPARPYRDALRFGEDYELYTRILLDGGHGVLVDALGYYLVQRPGSASRRQHGADHRRLIAAHKVFLARTDLSAAVRRALRGFLAVSRREWVNWELMGARRDGAALRAVGVFLAAPTETFRVVFGRLRGRSRPDGGQPP
jgi:glycosyltransferase involved in cell wall biosynthesis